MRFCRLFSWAFFLSLSVLGSGAALAADKPLSFHAHNDYEHTRPLLDALDAGFSSVEADVWSFWDGLFVSHFPFFGKSGPLESWYLDPWFKTQESKFAPNWKNLWIDIKGPGDRVERELSRRLVQLARSIRTGSNRPLIVLTGDSKMKRTLASESVGWTKDQSAFLQRDANAISRSDPPWRGAADPWRWYSLPWSNFFSWDGRGCIPRVQWKRMKDQVALAHLKKRKIRYFHAPGTVEWVWVARSVDLDLIDLDDLSLAAASVRPLLKSEASICRSKE